jgi:hypothetical protein
MYTLNNQTVTLKELKAEYPKWMFDTITSKNLANCDIINPENNQGLIYNALVDADDVLYYQAEKELTETSNFHAWSDTAMDKLKAACFEYSESTGIESIDRMDEVIDCLDIVNEHIQNMENSQFGTPREQMTIGEVLKRWSY